MGSREEDAKWGQRALVLIKASSKKHLWVGISPPAVAEGADGGRFEIDAGCSSCKVRLQGRGGKNPPAARSQRKTD